MSTQTFHLPDVGEGLTEAEIVQWRVAPGDAVAVNDVLVEIETAKSLVELPSPFAGTVGELLAPEGETVTVGAPIITIAAMATPQSEPMPPSTTIARMIALSRKLKLSGLMKPWRTAKNEPAKPPKAAPSAKAVSFVAVVSMPSDRHAISSSRRASTRASVLKM